MCVVNAASVPSDTVSDVNGTLDKNETIRYNFPIPVVGITVRVCVSEGHVVVYGSVSIPNPNSAFYDWMIDVEFNKENHLEETCNHVYFDPENIPTKPPFPYDGVTSSRLQPTPTSVPPTGGSPPPDIGSGSNELTDLTLYLSVIGIMQENNFNLNSSSGDTYPESTPQPNESKPACFFSQGIFFVKLACA